MACCCELQNTLDVDVTHDSLLDVEIGGSAGVLLQAKSVDITENGTSVVAPDDGFDGLKSVEINTNVPKRFECGDALFNINGYNGNFIYYKITKINVSCLVTAHTTSLLYIFRNLSSLTEIVGLENWDTSSVTDMQDMFNGCHSLRTIDVSSWDTSKVTNMLRTFLDNHLENIIGINNWNTSSLVSLYNTFGNCTSLVNLDLNNWNTSKVTSMFALFQTCINLKILDISGWDVSSCTDMNAIFNNCKSLLSIIGNKTLQDVENGTVAFKGTKVNIATNVSPKLRFSSILALANGLADLTGATAKTLTISSGSYNNMYNDDDTIPTKDVIAERQARIAAICAAKNWNFAH